MRKNIFDDFGTSSSEEEEKGGNSSRRSKVSTKIVIKKKSPLIKPPPPPRKRRGERFEEEEDFEVIHREDNFYTSREENIFDETELEESGLERKKVFKKNIDLTSIDRRKINYKRIEKVVFSSKNESEQTVFEKRKTLGLRVSGYRSLINPINNFSDVTDNESILRSLRMNRFFEPTPIQAQTIPIALSGRDLIAISQTGSGKTLAFVFSSILHFLKQSRQVKKASPIVIILSPTRELSIQIHRVLSDMTRHLSQKTGVVLVVGGVDKNSQFKDLRRDICDFIVGTPGRVIDLYKMKAFFPQDVTMVVLDEVDRMFEMGFGKQVESLLGQFRLDRQNLCFSATLHPRVKKLVHDTMVDPVEVRQTTVTTTTSTTNTLNEGGGNGYINNMMNNPLLESVNRRIQQRAVVVNSDDDKFRIFHEVHLPFFLTLGNVLVFVRSRVRTEELSTRLCEIGFIASSLHGEKNVEEREEVLFAFRNGTVRILVATDIASRGLDIPDIQTVVNYDVPKNLETYIHRIGRTGRTLTNKRNIANQISLSMNINNNNNQPGNKKKKKKKKSGFSRSLYDGNSVTFVERKSEAYFAPSLVQVIESVGQDINPVLLQLALRNPKFRNSRRRNENSSFVPPPPPPKAPSSNQKMRNQEMVQEQRTPQVNDGGGRSGVFKDRKMRYYSADESVKEVESEFVKHIRKQYQHSFVYSNTQYFDDTEEIEVIPPKIEEDAKNVTIMGK